MSPQKLSSLLLCYPCHLRNQALSFSITVSSQKLSSILLYYSCHVSEHAPFFSIIHIISEMHKLVLWLSFSVLHRRLILGLVTVSFERIALILKAQRIYFVGFVLFREYLMIIYAYLNCINRLVILMEIVLPKLSCSIRLECRLPRGIRTVETTGHLPWI